MYVLLWVDVGECLRECNIQILHSMQTNQGSKEWLIKLIHSLKLIFLLLNAKPNHKHSIQTITSRRKTEFPAAAEERKTNISLLPLGVSFPVVVVHIIPSLLLPAFCRCCWLNRQTIWLPHTTSFYGGGGATEIIIVVVIRMRSE